jgi:hypothetical protein
MSALPSEANISPQAPRFIEAAAGRRKPSGLVAEILFRLAATVAPERQQRELFTSESASSMQRKADPLLVSIG